ncbi:VOC family protein [Acidipila sp. EB88]|uniref:VOC family protein n=1 Tax=Acidipila sp. EB88 TaxID=2305226 RepID=UPI000F6031F5|nr:VOC family protein [Acidipila sp. EB88]RRA48234.1 VOC family protein [Acidipila sp. EB88]
MKAFVPYLLFNGNCRSAVQFYAEAFGAHVHVSTYAESGEQNPAVAPLVMHAKLTAPALDLMASDCPPDRAVPAGRSVALSVDCESPSEQDRLFAALGDGGTVTMPLQNTFWGARFGMLDDQFGIPWMFNYDLPASERSQPPSA